MKLVKRLVPARLRGALSRLLPEGDGRFAWSSFAQEGEDMILRRLFERSGPGFYVDVGAHHPRRFSNTYHFYLAGWRGINIDARPGCMEEFLRTRPRDINLEAAVAATPGELTYFMFDEPALNGFDRSLSEKRDGGPYRIVGERKMQTQRLDELLRRHLPEGVEIDFMSVDVEGLDLEVLSSNDWSLFRPRYVLAECAGTDLEALERDAIRCFMREKGYLLFAKTLKTVFYARIDAGGNP